MNIQFNKYQTPFSEEVIKEQPKEIQEQFYDCIENIPFIKRMLSPNRKYAKDIERNEEGKIIVDVTDPHILTDTDYFRPSALHYKQFGCYTKLKPNANPNSEFRKWLDEEIRRCWEGYVRPSDGEWITGDMYFFLNYCPIQLIKKDKSGKAIRTIDFPRFWDGHYLRSHYLYQCRKEGHHAMELASRGKGKSFYAASMLAKRYILGESNEVKEKVQCVATASERKYIHGANQLLDMFQYYIDFNANNTEFPRLRLTESTQELKWVMGYKDTDTGTNKGTLNSVMGITSKDDESKLRGSRGVLYLLEEAGSFPRLLNLYQVLRPSVEDGSSVFGLIYGYGCVCAGTKVWTNDGRYINIEDLKKTDGIVGYENDLPVKNTIGTLLEPKVKPCVRITFTSGNCLECSTDHPILKQVIHTKRTGKNDSREIYSKEVWIEAERLKPGDRVLEGRYIGAFGEDTIDDARLVGMLIGDGSYGQTKKQKRLPDNYQTLSEDDTKLLLAGLYDTNGCVTGNKSKVTISLTQCNKEILEQVAILLRKFGIYSYICKNKPSIKKEKKDKNPWYVLNVKGRINIELFKDNIPLMQKDKNNKLKKACIWFEEHPISKTRCYDAKRITPRVIQSVESIGDQTIYNLSAEQSHTYLANNIITHNTAGDSDSDFSSMQELMYNPKGYNIKPLNNVYDKEGQGRKEFTYFFPGYLDRADCYDSDGNSDVSKALLEILQDRYKVKYNSTDINAITKRVAEIPITPQEAILKVQNNIFPITEITQRLNEIDNNPSFYDDVYTGTLVMNSKGVVEFNPTTGDLPIRDFPTKDNKVTGCLEIYEMPQQVQGKIPNERYILSLDNYENDSAQTMSLGSMFVLDLWTDRIVAEYTGRPQFADDLNELCRKLCIFYNGKVMVENNKKNTFAYFSRMNSLHLMADTPDYLKMKQILKTQGFGNSSKGIPATQSVKNFAFGLISDWLRKPVQITTQEGNELIEKTVTNLHFIKGRALLKELMLFNPMINVDRIMSLCQLMLYREEKMILYQGDFTKSKTPDNNYLGNDPFFTNNFKTFNDRTQTNYW